MGLALILSVNLIVHPKPTKNSKAEAVYVFGKSIKLNGTTSNPQYITVPFNQSLSLSNEFTLEAWIKPDLPSTDASKLAEWTIINQNNESKYGKTFGLRYYTNGSTQVKYNVNPYVLRDNCIQSYPLPFNEQFISNQEANSWRHLAFVFLNGNLTIFNNGKILVKSESTYTGLCKSSQPIWIGASETAENAPFTFFQGEIDELRVSKVARYKENFSPSLQPLISDTDTIALYHFDGDANDASVNNNHGFPLGAIQYIDSTIAPLPSPTPTSSPVPTPTVKPTSTPTPTPTPNLPPEITTTSLPFGKKKVHYEATIHGEDVNWGDKLEMKAKNLPNGTKDDPFTFTCPAEVSNPELNQINCYLKGTPDKAENRKIKITLSDGVNLPQEKEFTLKIYKKYILF